MKINSFLKDFVIILGISLPIVGLFFLLEKRSNDTEQSINQITDVVIQKTYTDGTRPTSSITITITPTVTPSAITVSYTPKNVSELKQTGWIPYWDLAEGVNTLKTNVPFDSTSPVMYYLNADGSIKKMVPGNYYLLQNISQSKKIKIIPTIASFDASSMSAALHRDSSQTPLYLELSNEVTNQKYDGIDLDLESVALNDKELFLDFVKNLSEELHSRNKVLSVTVLSKSSDINTSQTLQVQDWDFLAQYADQIRIMTYDYTSPYSSKPGPIAPISWIESVVKYALTKIPANKIWLGINLYSYEWEQLPSTTDQNGNTVEGAFKTPAKAYLETTIDTVISSGVTTSYDLVAKEGVARYACGTSSNCVMYYPTNASIKDRKDLAAEYGIAGVTYWRLGREGELLK